MIYTHAHIISEFFNNIDSVIKDSKENGIIKIINCADSIETSSEVLSLSKIYDGYLLPTVGIHPEHTNEINEIDKLEKILKENKIIAIGEIGLDYHYDNVDRNVQLALFNKQLDLAEKYNLPVIIHTRDSIQDCFDAIKNRKVKGIIHCYSGSYEMAKEFIKKGFLLGIGGVLTFKNSKLYETIEKIDLESIVLETDSPFLSPEPYRGEVNKPANVLIVAKKISEIKKISLEEVIKVTTETASKLFDIL